MIFSRVMPDEERSRCINASYSPCKSLKKYSVPLGRLQIAVRLTISLVASFTVGYSFARSLRYAKSLIIIFPQSQLHFI